MGGKGSGRKPKPIEQIMEQGNYNVTRHREREPEKRGTGTAPLRKEPPEYLDAYGRDVWEQLFPEVTAGGLVTEAERELFALYCRAAGTARRAMENMPHGEIIDVLRPAKGDHPAYTVKGLSPWYDVLRDATADVAKLGSQLGLTSVDRGKVLKARPSGTTSAGGLPKSRPKTALDMGGPLRLASFDTAD